MKHKILLLPSSFKPPKFPHKLFINNSLESSTSSSIIKPFHKHNNSEYYFTNKNNNNSNINTNNTTIQRFINIPKRYISPITEADNNNTNSIKSNLRTRLFNIISTSMIMNQKEAEEIKQSYEDDMIFDQQRKELKKLNSFRKNNLINIQTNKNPNLLKPITTCHRYEDQYITPKEVLIKNFNKEEIEIMRRYPHYFKLERIPGIDNEMKTLRSLTQIINKEERMLEKAKDKNKNKNKSKVINRDIIETKTIFARRLLKTDGNCNDERDDEDKKQHNRANSCFAFEGIAKEKGEKEKIFCSNKNEDEKLKKMPSISIKDGHYKYQLLSLLTPSPSLLYNNNNNSKRKQTRKEYICDYPFPKEYFDIDHVSIIKTTILKRSLYKIKCKENIEKEKERKLNKKNLNDTLAELKRNYRILKEDNE